jgi:hypothetical protein
MRTMLFLFILVFFWTKKMGNHFAMFSWCHILHNIDNLQAILNHFFWIPSIFNGLESFSQAYLPWSPNESMLTNDSTPP